jgi:hypothetical protein
MGHIREVRPQAREAKFVIDADVAARIRQWARHRLDADIHGYGPNGDEYDTTSIYFDTDDQDVLHRRGSYARSKYRIRRYDGNATVFLERKMRQPAVLAKRRTLVPIDAIERLTESAADDDWLGSWFHRRLTARRLRPVCQIAYTRMARGIVRDGEQVRLTLDANLRALPAAGLRFAAGDEALAMAFTPDLILELKYRGALPTVFRQLVTEFALTPQPASKYRLGMLALGHAAPAAAERSVAIHA